LLPHDDEDDDGGGVVMAEVGGVVRWNETKAEKNNHRRETPLRFIDYVGHTAFHIDIFLFISYGGCSKSFCNILLFLTLSSYYCTTTIQDDIFWLIKFITFHIIRSTLHTTDGRKVWEKLIRKWNWGRYVWWALTIFVSFFFFFFILHS
jgi:hypothetical protein